MSDTYELNPEVTAEDFSVVRQEGSRKVSRSITPYNLVEMPVGGRP